MSADSDGADFSNVSSFFKRWYHIPLLTLLVLYMFWSRFQNYEVFQRGGEGFTLQAVDSWYHWRTTEWTVENFPWLIGYEPFTGFPDGTMPGQFGTLFDLIVASLAMVIGTGSPGEQDILLAALIAVPALAALVAIPTYYIGARLGGRIGGLAGVTFLALTTGEFFRRTTAGQFQHHVAEVLLMTAAVLAMMLALRVAEEDRPIWELAVQRNWGEFRRVGLYSALAGVALLLYIWAWPPGVVLIGIFGVFFVIQLSADYVRGRPPDHVAFVGIVSMTVFAVGAMTRIQESGFGATGLDYMPPTLALLVAAGCAFMAVLARQWETRDIERLYYPGAIGVSIIGALAVMWLVLPDLYSTLIGQVQGRITPIGAGGGQLTVAEAAPPEDGLFGRMSDEAGLAFFTAIGGLALLIFRPFFGRQQRAEHILIVVWSLFLFSMAAAQLRFAYYAIIPVAVLNAHLVGFLIRGSGLVSQLQDFDSPTETLENIETYQILMVGVVVMLLFVPLLPPVADATPMEAGGEGNTGPAQYTTLWEPANEWVSENTPELGEHDGEDNAGDLDYFGHYDAPDDGSFDYSPGAYGILSWWDYGHLITVQGERIPHSNPFQQNAGDSAEVLMSQDEEQAELFLDGIAAGEDIGADVDEDELRDAVGDSDDPGIEYVMIDDRSAGNIFSTITQWVDTEYADLVEQETFGGEAEDQEPQQMLIGGDYYDTFLANLYIDDAEGYEHYRLIHETDVFSIVGFTPDGQHLSQPVLEGDWGEAAEIDMLLEQAQQQGEPVNLGNLGAWSDAHITSAVKTFDRVEGATLTGETEPEATVTAAVPLVTGTDRPFTYEQSVEADADGTFEITVPYPTEETLGTEDGYAESTVHMNDDAGGYTLVAETDPEDGDNNTVVDTAENVSVPEDDIQHGETISVTMEEPPEDVEESDDVIDDEEDEGDIDETDGEIEDGDDLSDENETLGDTDDSDETTERMTTPFAQITGSVVAAPLAELVSA